MTFGQRVKQLRQEKGMTLRDLAPLVGVGFTYISKIENGRLDFGEYPSEALIRKLAKVLDADLDELFVLAQIVPDRIRRRVLERPHLFSLFASLDDADLDELATYIDAQKPQTESQARSTSPSSVSRRRAR